MSTLTADQEEDLRGYFCGALEEAAGCRSALGPMLDRMKYQLPLGTGNYQTKFFDDDDGKPIVYRAELPHRNDAEDRLIDCMAIVARQRLIREALLAVSRQQAETLRTAFKPIAEQVVWGLVEPFGDRETAAVAVAAVKLDVPGASQWQVLHNLIKRGKGKGASASAKSEFESRRLAAKTLLRESKQAYATAFREVRKRARERRSIGQEVLIWQKPN
jgi:hypothetical protein